MGWCDQFWYLESATLSFVLLRAITAWAVSFLASIRVLVSMTRVLVTFLFGLVLLIGPLVVSTVIFVTVLLTAALPFMGI
jgi:hypothetical protein